MTPRRHVFWLAAARYHKDVAVMAVKDFTARYLTHRCPVCRLKGQHKMGCYHVY
jgi:hypothetical protein